ncbi:MAG: rhodanese-like domain-containing protein [Deltaproteobacteria bacterium]|nr:rhodanese-like domain-containing protein [Deltaproteobacteria bacterium]
MSLLARCMIAAMLASTGCARTHGSSCCESSVAAASSSAQSREPGTMSLEQVATRVRTHDGRAFIFDANPREMYEQRHVPGARWVPYDGVTADVLPQDRSATVVFYCANPRCSASPHAARTAIALGWTNVYVMPDGIFGWVAAGLPVQPG